MFPAKVLHESSGSIFRPYLLSVGSTEPVWCRIGRQWLRIHMEEFRNRTVGSLIIIISSRVPIDTVAVANWCFLLRCCTNRVAASLYLTYYPGDRGNQCGVGLGRQWLRIGIEEFRNRTVWSRLTPRPFRTGVSCYGAARIEWQLHSTLPTI